MVSRAQEKGAPDFALVICDEAHRTTGVEQKDREKSYFLQVHDQQRLWADKRLYMTATPRIYAESAKRRGKEKEAEVYSMDDKEKYGEEFHRLDFSAAVQKNLLSDYKVLILGVDEQHVSDAMQNLLAENGEINLDESTRIIGCWNGLAKRISNAREGGVLDPEPMQRAVAFSQTIKASERVQEYFTEIVNEYQKKYPEEQSLRCEVQHVDGTYGAVERNQRLEWLRQDPGANACRVLSNVRCLSEGVDVPALDAVLFMNPRRSIIDIVQSVGRVMRKARGKKYGYIILPVAVPADESPEQVLGRDDNRYAVVWQVLQALRAHDDQFNAEINRIELNKKRSEKIVIDVVGVEDAEGRYDSQTQQEKLQQGLLNFDVEQWRGAIYARMVLKCGTRRYWENWARDVAEIAQRNSTRIQTLVRGSKTDYRERFDEFLTGLRQNLNPEVSEEDAIEMLSQHLITRPVFEALFENHDFAAQNPVSRTMQTMLELLDEQGLSAETRSLNKFYESVRERAMGIDNAEGRQTVVIELYEKFFQTAFPKMAERLGIVYTPVEVVDFILHSVDWLLRQEFGRGIGAADVHVLDPFAGTGTFISRLLQSSLIADKDLERKFGEELHANEIVLLAYYIAAINIEEAYHDRKRRMVQGGKGKAALEQQAQDINYEPFAGIVLTDTFHFYERGGDMLAKIFPFNSKRMQRQKKTPIQVVLGNPPYSVGQRSQNDANWNLEYLKLDKSIRGSYAHYSTATNKRSLYDSYIRAFRWASARIDEEGIVAYVSNSGWLDGRSMDGFRKCLQDEFSSIYCFNLRGNQRTSGEISRREGGKIFGSGSRAGIAILFLIKNPRAQGTCKIHYHDIGDYLKREQKLEMIREFGSAQTISWDIITPNAEHDWINQRDPAFMHWLPLGDKANKRKKETVASIFMLFCRGVGTNRDAWVYNFSSEEITANMRRCIDFYNSEVQRYQLAYTQENNGGKPEAKKFVNYDSKRIHWDLPNLDKLVKNKTSRFIPEQLRHVIYRPFCKQWLYFDKQWNNSRYHQPRIFPTPDTPNRAICVSGIGAGKEFSALMVDTVPDLHFLDTGQCFPRYRYEPVEGELYGEGKQWQPVDNIPAETVSLFRDHYGDQELDGDAIFHYVYGVLHSPEYKRRFAADLKKMLPRIPYAKTAADFHAFSDAGRQLAELHTGYEQLEPYPLGVREQNAGSDPSEHYRVRKMRFGGTARKQDKSTIRYNENITLEGIPLDVYDYVIHEKNPVEWVMDHYQISIHKDSSIRNDPNRWSDDPCYIIDLLGKVVRLSVDTMQIIQTLPKPT